MRTLLAIFLLSIFACQAMPVAALGKLCVKVKVLDGADQTPGDDDAAPDSDGKIKKGSANFEDFTCSGPGYINVCFIGIGVPSIRLHNNEHVPASHSGDIEIPPPDEI